jgi:hypothetical protein
VSTLASAEPIRQLLTDLQGHRWLETGDFTDDQVTGRVEH